MKVLIFILSVIANTLIYGQQVDFTLYDTDNNKLGFNDLKGEKLTLVDFWATWCKPCKDVIPELINIHDIYNGKVNVVGISVDGSRSINKVKPFISALNVNYPVLLDPGQELSGDLNIVAIPTLIITNETGEIIWIHEGYKPGDNKIIRNKIESLLNGK